MQENYRDAMKNPRVEQMMAGLSPEQSKRLTQILSDPAMTRKLMATPQAQQLLKKLMGEQRNG